MYFTSQSHEETLAAVQSLKKNTTEIAYTFKEAWMKIRKIYKLNEGIFNGLDVYLQDSLMKKSALLGSEARKDENEDPHILQKIIGELSQEFEDANALMRMMPRQILNTPSKLQNNLIYSQVHSALANTVHKDLLSKNADISDHIKVFSEISIKNNLKKANDKLFTTYLKGYEDAKRFSAMTKETADRINKAVDDAEEMQGVVFSSCEEGRNKADKIVDEAEKSVRSVRGEQERLIEDSYRDLRYWVSRGTTSF
ncbi:uncharacterized protein LOC116294163 [Actinia tenebrosa]|uniref:Uncharacterized protein LOC116294163 n=1 Tax=Actinia tenebrosa TaxID=6105 RepID=A0A6P8HR47_ACTTE|nr:uncharacterized protein LOC116294163 [Actinia tenebrosa]